MRFRKPGTLVLVTWEDAYSCEDWGPVEERLDQHDEPMLSYTIGIVLKHNKAGITIARTYARLDHSSEGSFYIPNGMIRDIDDWKGLLIDIKINQ